VLAIRYVVPPEFVPELAQVLTREIGNGEVLEPGKRASFHGDLQKILAKVVNGLVVGCGVQVEGVYCGGGAKQATGATLLFSCYSRLTMQ
jgi:hypothetical protein